MSELTQELGEVCRKYGYTGTIRDTEHEDGSVKILILAEPRSMTIQDAAEIRSR